MVASAPRASSYPDGVDPPLKGIFYFILATVPSLELFDEFNLKACGYYCHHECALGFPTVLLKEYIKCRNNTRKELGYSEEGRKHVEEQLQVDSSSICHCMHRCTGFHNFQVFLCFAISKKMYVLKVSLNKFCEVVHTMANYCWTNMI